MIRATFYAIGWLFLAAAAAVCQLPEPVVQVQTIPRTQPVPESMQAQVYRTPATPVTVPGISQVVAVFPGQESMTGRLVLFDGNTLRLIEVGNTDWHTPANSGKFRLLDVMQLSWQAQVRPVPRPMPSPQTLPGHGQGQLPLAPADSHYGEGEGDSLSPPNDPRWVKPKHPERVGEGSVEPPQTEVDDLFQDTTPKSPADNVDDLFKETDASNNLFKETSFQRLKATVRLHTPRSIQPNAGKLLPHSFEDYLGMQKLAYENKGAGVARFMDTFFQARVRWMVVAGGLCLSASGDAGYQMHRRQGKDEFGKYEVFFKDKDDVTAIYKGHWMLVEGTVKGVGVSGVEVRDAELLAVVPLHRINRIKQQEYERQRQRERAAVKPRLQDLH